MTSILEHVLRHLEALVAFDTRNPPRRIGADGIFDYVRAQLSEDYAPLFDTAPPEAPEPVSSTSSRRGP